MNEDRLYIVMPAYNEEANIEDVVKDWHPIVEKISKDSRLCIFDDGSKDATFAKLKDLEKHYPQLRGYTKENTGHGATLLYAYRHALKSNATHIFQTDSDGQTIATEFWDFWDLRSRYSVIIGERTDRKDGFSRIFVTKVLKAVLGLVFGKNLPDANTPFRLMSSSVLNRYINCVPENFNLSNVLLSVLFYTNEKDVLFLPITFRERQGGKNSINIRSITVIGIKAIRDFIHIKKVLKRSDCAKS